ncbi:hypothetical protein GQ600_7127 [Phytophthora cactorum]|nr:hypothetical protein GQ600_7127 [Phytophthora cactorum]
MLLTLLEKLPLGQGGKVFVGTSICLAICAYPVIRKPKGWPRPLLIRATAGHRGQEVKARREKLNIE